MATETFSKWARGFSGCDGGNLNGEIWICGIEYSAGDTEASLKEELSRDVSSPPLPRDNPKDFLNWRYNQSILKMLCALAGSNEHYKEFFASQREFGPESNYFKLNVYPLAFKSVKQSLWTRWHAELTGFNIKNDCLDWCRANRFSWLRTLVEKHRPKLVLCTGADYREDFFEAFGGQEREPYKSDDEAGKRIWYLTANGGETLVTVTYFPGGRHGLNSNEKLSATGQRLAQLLRDHGLTLTALGGYPG